MSEWSIYEKYYKAIADAMDQVTREIETRDLEVELWLHPESGSRRIVVIENNVLVADFRVSFEQIYGLDGDEL